MKRTIKEDVVRRELKKRVESYGGEIRAVAWLGRKHAPDVLVLMKPPAAWHTFVETKRPRKGATEAQAREHERMREAGCNVLVITTLEELNAWLPPR